MPLFSIIVPIYNVEEYLDKCICSILNQTFTDFELILVDDGSPDNCPKLCDEYEKKDSRIKVIHKENGGLSSARNAGLDIANGKYIYFVDSDDYIKTNLLEIAVSNLKDGADLFVFQQDMLKKDNSVTYVNHDTGTFSFSDDKERRDFIVNKLLTCSIGWEAWNRVFVRDLIEKYHLRFEDNRKIFAEDLYFSLCYCAHVNKIISISDDLYIYLIRDDSIMGKDKFKLNIGRYNELAKSVFMFYEKWNDCKLLIKDFSIIHYLICSNNLSTNIDINVNSFLEWRQNVLDNIADKQFFLSQIRKLKKYKSELKNIIGGSYAELAVSFMKFLKSGNYYTLRLRNHFIYKYSEYLNMHTGEMKKILLKYKEIGNYKNRVFLLGTEEFGNIGDNQINESTFEFIKNTLPDYYIHEVTLREWNKHKTFLKRYIRKNEIIIFAGGGNFGDVYESAQNFRTECIQTWKENPKIIFPQTIYFTDTEKGQNLLKVSKDIYTKDNNVYLFLRETKSYEVAKNNFSCDCILAPDIVLASDFSEKTERGSKVLLCFRSDSEKSLSENIKQNLENLCISLGYKTENTDLQLMHHVIKTERRKIIDEKLNLWKSSKLVITDRLHGMVFAAITGTPCIVFSNYNHKVKGTYEWIKYLPYIRYAETFEDAEKYLPELLSMENCSYDNTPLIPYFEKLAEVVKTYAKN